MIPILFTNLPCTMALNTNDEALRRTICLLIYIPLILEDGLISVSFNKFGEIRSEF